MSPLWALISGSFWPVECAIHTESRLSVGRGRLTSTCVPVHAACVRAWEHTLGLIPVLPVPRQERVLAHACMSDYSLSVSTEPFYDCLYATPVTWHAPVYVNFRVSVSLSSWYPRCKAMATPTRFP